MPVKEVFYFRTTNENSLTHAPHFNDYKLLEGLIYNYEHLVNTCKKDNIPFRLVMIPVTNMMVKLYSNYLHCAKYSPELLEKNMVNLKYFYHNVYKQYEKVNQLTLKFAFSKELPHMLENTSSIISRINLNRFIEELKS